MTLFIALAWFLIGIIVCRIKEPRLVGGILADFVGLLLAASVWPYLAIRLVYRRVRS